MKVVLIMLGWRDGGLSLRGSVLEPEEPSYWSVGMRYACSFVRPRSDGEVDLGSDEVNGVELREMNSDYPPNYEECTGPGATQLYRPTEAPPSYWLIDTCFTDGRFHLRTISVDLPPSYESVCGACPPAPSSLLPLPGPNRVDGPPTTTQAVISSAEMSV
ncbi:protein BEAN1 [Rhynchonycteris naso]